ncbi:hypothetical protein K458DRAFT_390242 [Lentithecium fluviatile CBS 122367]|uniref:F-box domain-containing protein n=1 Tax=Lentithecium fluviatile CBS 122367 TaxID=1168545 RepID=A0A6G1IXY4_9PLEO|nr:hypothetical protein K458DRAFT_390242 [Lentithecium fluviatile CBS 122367]
MEKDDRHTLFLPNLLPCPGPGRCDFHATFFGQSDHNEVPKEWFCQKCQKKHFTTVSRPSSMASVHATNHLALLPAELLLHIATYLPKSCWPSLALTSRMVYQKIGLLGSDVLGRDKLRFMALLARDMPAYATCSQCERLRPNHSALAWPLLKCHRWERRISNSVYAASEFLADKLVDSHEYQYDNGVCPSLLNCAGTYRKPWTPQIGPFIKRAGFSQQEVDLGLAIGFEATGRIFAPASKLLTHIKYRIELRHPWTSYTIAQRGAVLQGFYLCPHTLASKVQPRDPRDPTYPADSSMAHWQSHQGPMPIALWACPHCSSEFRSAPEFDSEREQYSVVFEVWRESTKNCNDGMIEMTFCGNPNKHWWSKLGRIREMWAAATPI